VSIVFFSGAEHMQWRWEIGKVGACSVLCAVSALALRAELHVLH